jgi:carbonic anhydrase/acetyltransferase-like protein (isoleucine patch superfamily)
LEGAHIGNYCLIGAGAVVTGGARVPDHSLVIGVPGQVFPLSKQHEKMLLNPTANYIRNARVFIDAGF